MICDRSDSYSTHAERVITPWSIRFTFWIGFSEHVVLLSSHKVASYCFFQLASLHVGYIVPMISYHMTKRLSHDDVSKYHMILRMGMGAVQGPRAVLADRRIGRYSWILFARLHERQMSFANWSRRTSTPSSGGKSRLSGVTQEPWVDCISPWWPASSCTLLKFNMSRIVKYKDSLEMYVWQFWS